MFDFLFQAVCKFIGVDAPTISKRKFLVTQAPVDFPIGFHDSTVEHTYLLSEPSQETRLRKRGQLSAKNFNYTLTFRFKDPNGNLAVIVATSF